MNQHVRGFGITFICLFALVIGSVTPSHADAVDSPGYTLIVGGGPDIDNNQAAIESNVRYVAQHLTGDTRLITLFADGKPQHATVSYVDDSLRGSTADQLFAYLLDEDQDTEALRYRRPNLGVPMEGAARGASLWHAFHYLKGYYAARPSLPLLLYFTGHGSPDSTNHNNNEFDLWNDDSLSVQELALQIGALPPHVPVTLVMAQCYAGSFGNIIFENGDPERNCVSRSIAGFFATTKDRYAAGCTPEINEADYRDFTGYFFAALAGRDRQGRAVVGADYDGDGRVEMNEAFCYTLSHDESIDVPICTSDLFLRKYVPLPDVKISGVPFSKYYAWAGPAQRAALDDLSQQLGLTGENRVATALQLAVTKPVSLLSDRLQKLINGIQVSRLEKRMESLRHRERHELLRRWPVLNDANDPKFPAARAAARASLDARIKDGDFDGMLQTQSTLNELDSASDEQDVVTAKLLRFATLAKSVILAHRLLSDAPAAVVDRYQRLIAAENRPMPGFAGGY